MQEEVTTQQLRSFGLLVGGIFVLIGLWPMLVRSQGAHLWIVLLGGLLIVPAFLWPVGLRPIYRVWMVVGQALGWVNTRVILSIGFYGMFTPTGLAMRLMDKDPMHRKFDRNMHTYRVIRSARSGAHMQRQF